MIVAADDVRNLHLGVVDHHHVVVNRHAAGAQDDGVADHLIGKLDRAAHHVVKAYGALGNVQADGAGLSRLLSPQRFGRIELAAGSRIDRRTMFFHRLLALLVQFLRRAEAVISLALGDQTFGVLKINGELVTLAIRRERTAEVGSLVPVEPQPFQIVQQLPLVAALAALDVGVFYAQDHGAALLPGKEPVEERGAGIADMHLPGG